MKIGIIGLGEVAQLMHLPILQDMRDKFTIAAAADISPSLLNFIRGNTGYPKALAALENLLKNQISKGFLFYPRISTTVNISKNRCEKAGMFLWKSRLL